ncbi:MFS transporter [Desulfoluna spongiiphila]|uniref:MFS transporter, NNP family, nitrate/nitrite transporter n=1 Tax=Desulfoluna spongiiphila TaxID=419481 RepID=A0A1G5FKH2_9BACT|nr:MFS transporter [Desulfoluna spongiiphila]SCY39756.1 MFS transporter, NNP family, nitrate/nitrite transporter [Desulfoluna spongiiphila]
MPRSHTSAVGFRSTLPWIFIITAMYFLSFFARSILSPLLVPMESAFATSHAETAGLMLFLSLGFGSALALAGIVSSRIRHRNVLVMAIVTLGVSLLLLAKAPGLMTARLAFFIFGVGSGLYLPSGMATLASVADGRFWGRAIAIHELAPNIAFIIAPVAVEAALGVVDWRGILMAMGLACFLGSALFLKFGRGGDEYGTAPDTETLPLMIKRPAFWAIMVLIGLGVGLESGPYSLTPLFLVSEKGMTPSAANHLLSSSRLITPFMALAGGWLADRVRIPWILIGTITGSAASLTGMGFLDGTGLSVAIMVQASMPALMFPAVFKSVTEVFGVKEQSLVLSLTMPVAVFVALGVIPTLLGWCGDRGHFGYGFAAVGAMTLFALGALPFLKKQASGGEVSHLES